MALTEAEEKELDMLAFRSVADLPFSMDDLARYVILKKKKEESHDVQP